MILELMINEKFEKIRNFLRPYEYIWNYEVLNFYPNSFPYKKEWIDQLDALSDEQLWKLDSKSELGPIEGELRELFEELNHLSHPTDLPESWEVPRKLAFKMGHKKKHEISKIYPQIKKAHNKASFKHAVDLGGGVGHLSRAITHELGLKTYCLDCDGELLSKGKKRETEMRVDVSVDFIHANIGGPIQGYLSKEGGRVLEGWEDLIKNSLVLGLHTCGELSNKVYELYLNKEAKGLIHFGCCYHKTENKNHFNLSKTAQKSPLELKLHALTLASGPHPGMSFKDFEYKKRVKYYRNALHLFMIDKNLSDGFKKVGPSPMKDYYGSFSQYALKKIEASAEELDQYFMSEKIQKTVRELLLANIIRSRFSRALELYINLDRALLFQEKGHEVEVKEFFRDEISPRNIGIIVTAP